MKTSPALATLVIDNEWSCSVCEHPANAHDVVARRFCEATQLHALVRSCICAPA